MATLILNRETNPSRFFYFYCMNTLHKYLLAVLMILCAGTASAQSAKPVYHPCFLLDSVDKRLDFIKANASRVFVDSFDCKETLLDSIGKLYIRSKNKKYLDVLTSILQNPNAKVEGLYIDVIKDFLQDDFGGFVNELYIARGKYQLLEKELIGAMNMIVDGKPFKQKYMGQLNLQISIAKDKKDSAKIAYLEKLKVRIEEDKY